MHISSTEMPGVNSWAALPAAFTAAALAAALIVRWVRKMGTRRGLLDHPNARSSHHVPTPRGGGIGIVLVALASITLLAIHASMLVPLGVGIACIAAVGLIDDFKGLSPIARLLVHVAVAVFTVIAYGPLREVAFPDLISVDLGFAGPVLSVAWIVGLTNAYNFMDGIDGIAAGQAVVAGTAWMLLFFEYGHVAPAIVTAVVTGASVGFIIFNWSPASIFMGDVGSGALGYLFATMPFLLRAAEPDELSELGWFFAAATLVPFVFDSSYTFIARAQRRENVLQAHRSHLYQRLVGSGLSHARVATVYILLAVYTSGLGFAALHGLGWITLVALAAPLVLLVVRVRGIEKHLGDQQLRRAT